MVNKCCVPGCDSNYKRKHGSPKKTSCFEFPKDEIQREKWIRKIPREDLKVTKYTVVCEKHFLEEDIIRFDTLPGKDGHPDIHVPRTRVKLRVGACPSIFPNLPSYLTSIPPPQRTSPETKRRKICDREEEKFNDFLEMDKIDSFLDFKDNFLGFLKKLKYNISTISEESSVILYLTDFSDTDGLSIHFSIRITKDLICDLWCKNVNVAERDCEWIIPKKRLHRWSQLENILSHYCATPQEPTKESLFNKGINILCQYQRESESDVGNNKNILNFLLEQLRLTQLPPSRRRFSAECMIASLLIYSTSPSVYRKLRDSFLLLPSLRLLRLLSSSVSLKSGLIANSFLVNELKYLCDKDLHVNLLIDEVHVKSKLSYRGEELIGQAVNDPTNLAKSLQCFMISSLLSNHKLIVGMFPVVKMTSEFLCELTKDVIENVSKAGFNVVSVISDNNRVNRKMFSILSKDSESNYYITSPVNKDHKIFLLFDTVHLLKSIRNNWLNLKNESLTFSCPKWVDNDTTVHASFSDLRQIYRSEKNNLLKEAHSLSWKALYPHSLERQKVSLALKIFNESNIAALKTLGPSDPSLISWEGTVHFLSIICHWWDIINVHHQYYGRNKIKPSATPFFSIEDSRLTWLSEMSAWLRLWKDTCKISHEGFLSQDTFFALTHSLECMIHVIKYCLTTLNFKFVLSGKFQTDDLEGRFGQYRQLSGGNSLISVEEALQNERKLTVRELLKINSKSKGKISLNIKCFLSEFTSETLQERDLAFINNFPCEKIEIQTESLDVIIYVAGYVAKKIISKTVCSLCCQFVGDKEKSLTFTIDEKVLAYFEHLNRGGLTYPSPTLVNMFQVALSIMNIAVGSMEQQFLCLSNQKQTLLKLNEKYWMEDDLIEFASECPNCQCPRHKIFHQCLSSFVNILLNNYCKKTTETCHSSQSVTKKSLKFM